MYQNIFYDRFNNEVHLWDDELGYHCLTYERYAYKLDPNGSFQTLDGRAVSRVTDWHQTDVFNNKLFESDVRPEMRMLIDLYHESDEVSKNHCIFYFDIEVAKEGKYSPAERADNTITSFSFYDSISKQYSCFLLDPDNNINPDDFSDVHVRTFTHERDMILAFMKVWRETPITIVTGWNVLWYDIQYLYNRIEKVIGKWEGNKLSKIGKVENYTTKRGQRVFRIAGITVLDYMALFKKFELGEESSYSLNAIALKVLKRGKVDYDKDLDHLYKTDPKKFIEYNVEDVRLVVDIDDEKDFINWTLGTCHKGHVPYEDIFFTSRYMEGACLTETRRRGLVATKSKINSGDKAKGAFVKRSRPGRYSWVYDLDLTSLYPSNIMTLNISPETKVGRVLDWDSDAFTRGDDRLYNIEFVNGTGLNDVKLREFLTDKNYSVSANGIVYDLNVRGLIPSLLEMWFAERKDYRKLASEAHAAGDMDKYEYFNRKQKVQKVLLNSLYGVLLLPIFRFYDKENGEAVTTTGQQLIHYTTSMANYYYNNELGTEGIDYCLYTDTDSVFYESMPLIEHRYGDVDEEDIPNLTIKIATDVQDFINRAYDMYADRFHNVGEHKWNIKQELVSKRAFWGSAKKRYAMWIVREGNEVMDEPDIKGFDSVRSSFPKIFRTFMNDIIVEILKDGDLGMLNKKVMEFKKDLENYEIFDIMNPTSVQNLEKWIPMRVDQRGKEVVDDTVKFLKSTPIHVKSAMNYNRLMRTLGIDSVPELQSGDKIVWTYLTDNPYGFNSIALRGYDDPEEMVEFVQKYINRDKLFDRNLENKLQGIWDDLGWGKIVMNKNVYKFFDFS